MQVKDLKQDHRNYRKHNERNLDLIKKSINEVGLGRSIVIDSENEIVCGNGLVSQLDKNTPVKVIETDGSELVVVKRTDLNTDDEKRKRLAVMDNSTSDSSEFDLELLSVDFDEDALESMGLEIPEIEEEEKKESKYTRKVTVPVYTIKGENPTYSEMVDTTRADKLIKQIDASSVDDDFKKFLKLAATRLYEFRYDKIAEFYAHKSSEEQELMEKLALVIIDFNKAIENGYIELNNFIEECFLQENDIDE